MGEKSKPASKRKEKRAVSRPTASDGFSPKQSGGPDAPPEEHESGDESGGPAPINPQERPTLTGANVLRLIRDGVAVDMKGLCRQFGVPYDGYSSVYIEVKINNLKEAGLIVETGKETYKVAEAWKAIQSSLEISLTKAAQISPNSLVVNPLFGRPDKIAPIDVFVAMPFSDELLPIWKDHIKKVVEQGLKLKVKRADDVFSSHSVMADVWSLMCEARVIVADCTNRNPNVFYEIGMAHTLGKPVVLITQKADDVPFDLRHIRYIKYEYTPPGMSKFESTLQETLQTTLQG